MGWWLISELWPSRFELLCRGIWICCIRLKGWKLVWIGFLVGQLWGSFLDIRFWAGSGCWMRMFLGMRGDWDRRSRWSGDVVSMSCESDGLIVSILINQQSPIVKNIKQHKTCSASGLVVRPASQSVVVGLNVESCPMIPYVGLNWSLHICMTLDNWDFDFRSTTYEIFGSSVSIDQSVSASPTTARFQILRAATSRIWCSHIIRKINGGITKWSSGLWFHTASIRRYGWFRLSWIWLNGYCRKRVISGDPKVNPEASFCGVAQPLSSGIFIFVELQNFERQGILDCERDKPRGVDKTHSRQRISYRWIYVDGVFGG